MWWDLFKHKFNFNFTFILSVTQASSASYTMVHRLTKPTSTLRPLPVSD